MKRRTFLGITSLGRPGGNVTGLALDPAPEIYAKRLELLRTLLPRAARTAVLRAWQKGRAMTFEQPIELALEAKDA